MLMQWMSAPMLMAGMSELSTSLRGTASQHTQSSSNDPTHAGIHLSNTGIEYAFSSAGSATGSDLGPWLESGTVGDFWVRATVNSGALAGGTAGVWQSLSLSRSWWIEDASLVGGAVTASVTVEISTDSAGGTIIDSATYSLSANRESGS